MLKLNIDTKELRGEAIPGAVCTASGEREHKTVTDQDGKACFQLRAGETVTVRIEYPDGEEQECKFKMPPLDIRFTERAVTFHEMDNLRKRNPK